ncbi:FtsW/RodA/SpoVE family cell cycle protein [Christiangramia sediminis]|uniref:Probable peptidoglycan glycosyltransferase FtsW n=1 Tax=Christiangramia sediminis TaxID=2881336 RepID=A0A9X1RXT4_9FLAO|nr:FtsW/RodA/SpoVE family cell cycle protein [Christiangramia sediminis]MCB7481159.1 FtsW/RodA/SpoVE family cell cycle protein [Christiangramia sediminis]
MSNLFANLKGDKVIWAVAGLLAIFSFLPVYSASSNLAYLHGDGSTSGYLVVHFFHLLLGFCVLFAVHKIPYHYFRGISILLLPIVILLLLFTIAQGTTIDGAYASRWIQIPVLNVSFQSSTLAAVVLMVYVARYLSKITEKTVTFKETILPLWVPVFLVLILILPANFSTTAIIFSMILILMFLGGYPLKYLGAIMGAGIIMLSIFILTAKAFPGLLPNRVDTWTSRIETFFDDEEGTEQYQVERAKTAIAQGGITGTGIGKSVQRNFLPQSSSDFIYAIIVEEMGLIGGFGVMLAYLLLLFRIVIVATKANTVFGKLVVMGVGLPVVFQALINMGVAVELFPVTGQTLPLVSSGGTSVWMTCIALGIILSVSAKREEIKESENKEFEGEEDNPLDILSEAI